MFLAQSRRAGRDGGASNKRTTPPASYLHRPSAKRNDPSFDHLVGAREQRGRNFKAKRAGGGQIDDQLKLARLHYRQVGRLSTLEDFAGVDADLTVRFRRARSVAHEAASFRILAYIVDGWNRMSCRQCGKLETP